MVDPATPGDDPERWANRLRAHAAYARLFEAADPEVGLDQPSDPRFVEADDADADVSVLLEYEDDSGEYRLSVHGLFDADGDLIRAVLREGRTPGVLAGSGGVWTYEDGEVTEVRWIS